MHSEFASFAFISTLAAVINGLGIVRWLNALVDYLSKRDSMTIQHYWVFALAAAFQFLLHVLMWWSLWSIRGNTTINFFTYIYILTGPILMFVGSAFLAPSFDGDRLNLRQHYYSARAIYSSVLILIWTWTFFLALVIRGYFVEHSPVFAMFLILAIAQRVTDSDNVHRLIVVLNWLVLFTFVSFYALELGGLAPMLNLDAYD